MCFNLTSFGPLKISIFHEWIDETAKIGHLSTSLPLKISIFHEWIDEAAGGRVIVGVAQDLDDAGMLQSGELPHLIVELQLDSLGVLRGLLQFLDRNLQQIISLGTV